MLRTRRLTVLAAPAVVLGLAACSGGGSSEDASAAGDPAPVTGIPQAWLDATAEAYPESDGYGSPTPQLELGGECLTYDGEVEIAGAAPRISTVGFGGLGAEDAYRYVCGIHDSDHYAGDVQLIHVGDGELARQVLDNTMDDSDSEVQENDVHVVEAGGVEIHVLKRWYPTNPQGMYIALYVDEDAGALLGLEVNSLDEEDFADYTEQDVADDLVRILGSA